MEIQIKSTKAGSHLHPNGCKLFKTLFFLFYILKTVKIIFEKGKNQVQISSSRNQRKIFTPCLKKEKNTAI